MKGDEMLDKIAGIDPAYIEAASVSTKVVQSSWSTLIDR